MELKDLLETEITIPLSRLDFLDLLTFDGQVKL